jgi:hypothetical protein
MMRVIAMAKTPAWLDIMTATNDHIGVLSDLR